MVSHFTLLFMETNVDRTRLQVWLCVSIMFFETQTTKHFFLLLFYPISESIHISFFILAYVSANDPYKKRFPSTRNFLAVVLERCLSSDWLSRLDLRVPGFRGCVLPLWCLEVRGHPYSRIF